MGCTKSGKRSSTKQKLNFVYSNDLKKGDKVRLKNGWDAVMIDNKRGNIRMAEVHGIHTEIGSIYAWDINYRIEEDGTGTLVKLTPKQEKDKEKIEAAMQGLG